MLPVAPVPLPVVAPVPLLEPLPVLLELLPPPADPPPELPVLLYPLPEPPPVLPVLLYPPPEPPPVLLAPLYPPPVLPVLPYPPEPPPALSLLPVPLLPGAPLRVLFVAPPPPLPAFEPAPGLPEAPDPVCTTTGATLAGDDDGAPVAATNAAAWALCAGAALCTALSRFGSGLLVTTGGITAAPTTWTAPWFTPAARADRTRLVLGGLVATSAASATHTPMIESPTASSPSLRARTPT